MDNNFSSQVKEIISLSRKEALRLGNGFISTEHLMLGLIREGNNAALYIFKTLDLDLGQYKKALEIVYKDYPGTVTANDSIPLTKFAEKVIRGSVLEAKKSQSPLIKPEHLVLSVLSNKENDATQMLHASHIDYKTFNQALLNKQTPLSIRKVPDNAPVFFSYAWGGESENLVDEMYDAFVAAGYQAIRDRTALHYKDLISDFMQKLGKGKTIIIALSDRYLRSENCMFELYEMYRNSGLDKYELIKKIYPIRVEKLDLGNPKVITDYFKHWQHKEMEWEQLVLDLGTNIQEAQLRQYRKIRKIIAELGELLDILKDINSLTKEELSKQNFAEIRKAVMAATGV